MKPIFSIIMEWGLGLPTGTIAFWGTLVPRILTVDYTFLNIFLSLTMAEEQNDFAAEAASTQFIGLTTQLHNTIHL